MKCSFCNSKNIIKNGLRKNKYETKQIYLCKKCNKTFFLEKRNIKNKTYKPIVIYSALNLYNRGYSLRKISKEINRRYKVKTNKSTIHNWIFEYKKLCPIIKYNKEIRKNKEKLILKKRFEHINLEYEYMLHFFKLEKIVKDKYKGLYGFLKNFEKGCPNVFFEIGLRCSEPFKKIKVKCVEKKNYACRAADFSVLACSKNILRHKFVEDFMLINDRSTVASEVPVWYWDKKIDEGVTGHIDILQVRNKKVYILDYKPNAKKDKKASSQLFYYAKALSYRTKISLDKIVCAWFDKDSYFEFRPNTINLKYCK